MADIYVDASRPDDSGDGSLAFPKRTPRAAQLIATPGSKILLKAGYCYEPYLRQYFYIDSTSNLEIGAYGTASDLPVLDSLTYQNPGVGGWTHVSGGIWKKTFGQFYIRRLWIGSTNGGILTTQRTVGTAMRRATNNLPSTDAQTMKGPSAKPAESTILAALNSANIWFGAGSALSYALYIYTGSASIDPPTYYNGIAFIQADGTSVGVIEPIHIENQTGIYVHDIKIRGAGSAAIQLFARNSNSRDVADCLFENIEVTHPFFGAFASRIGFTTGPLWRIRSCTARNIHCDYSTNELEAEPNLSYNYLSGVVDLFDIGEGSIGVGVEECTAINGMHNGLAAHSKGMRTAPPSGCWMINNTVRFDEWHTYARGINAVDGNTLFQGNLIDGQNVRTQLGGSVKIIGNVWTNMRQSTRSPTVSQWIICESYVIPGYGTGIGNEVNLRINPVDLVIANNRVDTPAQEAINFSYHDSSSAVPPGEATNTFDAGTIKIHNNDITLAPSEKLLTTFEISGKVIGQQIITHNGAYNTLTGDSKIAWRGSNYSINAAPGCSNNLENDSMCDSLHRPATTSYRRSGTYVGGKDYYGKHFYNPPSIGAVEDYPTPAWETAVKKT